MLKLEASEYKLLALAMFVLFLLSIGLVGVNNDVAYEQADTHEKANAEYQIQIKQDKGFYATLADDPIAYYTKMLFVATAVLAAFTIMLAIVTVQIWRDSRKQETARTAFEAKQMEFFEKSIQQGAENNEITRELFAVEKRAWLQTDIKPSGSGLYKAFGQTRIHFALKVKNVGLSPAVGCKIFSKPLLRAVGSPDWEDQLVAFRRECLASALSDTPGMVFFNSKKATWTDEEVSFEEDQISVFLSEGEDFIIPAFMVLITYKSYGAPHLTPKMAGNAVAVWFSEERDQGEAARTFIKASINRVEPNNLAFSALGYVSFVE